MLSVQGYIDLLNDHGRKLPKHMDRWQQIYYGMSLHIDGIMPWYYSLRDVSIGWIDSNLSKIYPDNCGDTAHQALFDNVHFNRHPREPEIIRNWRKSQYKPFTKEPFHKAIQVITGSIFQDSGYQLTVEDKNDNDYIWGNNFHDKNLIQYVADHFLQICEDPNGFFVVIPKEPYYKTTTPRIEPNIYFVHSKDVRHYEKDEIVFCKGDVCWAINTEGYYRFVKDGNKWIKHPEDIDGYFAHRLGYLPIVIAGGQWNAQGYYDSWLNAAKPFADEYIGAKSAEQLVNKEASHPFIISSSEDCPDCNGVGKVNCCGNCYMAQCECDNYVAGVMNCKTCDGCGKDISRNPGQWKIVPIEDMDKEAIKFVAPPVDINKFHAENNKEIYNNMLRALHLNYIEEAQSGVAKDKDMQTRYQFISKICNDLFDRVITKIVNYITALRNVSSNGETIVPTPKPFIIVKPTEFEVKTAQDLLNEYETATKAKIPAYIRKAQIADYTDKQYGGDEVQNKKVWYVNQKDIFAVSTEEEITTMLLNGVDNRLYLLHIQLDIILSRIIREKSSEWFVKAKYQDIDMEVDRIFNELIPPSDLPPTI